MRGSRAPGAAGAKAFAELQSCAPDGGGAALPAALEPSRCLPMGAVRAPPPAASGAGPREPVGNRAPIGPPDNRSASGQPIRGGGCRSGAFGVGLESDYGRTPGIRAAARLGARGWRGTGRARSGDAFLRGSGSAARGDRPQAAEARRAGGRPGSP
ncbi:collagen alpha-2(I) chain-like [Symphalangus syndactylus]|uniref:collagen alpha-2(I) chain-like n=1 Tax=Symphalangus syndactylus TaxID=9590 RepID=UPI00300436ED